MPKTDTAPPPQESPAQAVDDTETPSQAAPEAELAPEQVEAEPSEPAPVAEEKTYTQGDLDARAEEARREAQGEGRKEFAAWRQRYEGDQRDLATYNRLEALRTSDDPEQRDTFTREIVNPELHQSYGRGQQLHTQPPPEVSEELHIKAMADVIGDFIAQLQDIPELKKVKRDESGRIPLDIKPNNASEHGLALFKLAVQHAGKAVAEVELEKARKAERQKVLDELGVGPEQLEGGPTEGRLPTLAEIGKMSVEKVAELECSGVLDKAIARGK